METESTIIARKLGPGALLPTRAHNGDAGLDLYATDDGLLMPGDRATFWTHVRVRIPARCVGLVCSRSGLAAKYGVHVLNGPGILDQYDGDVGVILHNAGRDRYQVRAGDRIAQLVVVPFVSCGVVEGDVAESQRAENGFGSTGV